MTMMCRYHPPVIKLLISSPMFYDLCLKNSFKSWEDLGDADCDGFVIENPDAHTANSSDGVASKPVYLRKTLKFANGQEGAFKEATRHHDIVCAELEDLGCIKSASKLEIDLIRVPLDTIKHARKTLPGILKEKNIYLELCVRDALYENKALWMNSLRRLLRLGCKNCIVLSSGAEKFTELRGARDMAKILGLYGISEDKAGRMLDNTRQLLRRAALRKYSVDSAVVSLEDEGRFKQDFIIDYCGV